MISKSLEDAINKQIAKEFYSAQLYLAMSAYSESVNLPGAAHWMKQQFAEEQGHAMKMFEYLHDRGGRAVLQATPQPPVEYASLLDVFQKTLAHEREVTNAINALYAAAGAENDYAAQVFLQWFITEQVEEEKTAVEMVDNLTRLGDSPTGLVMMDRYLASRG